jgi:aldehyde:ferredoxin oxidoreductase
MAGESSFRVLVFDLGRGQGKFIRFGDKVKHLGGSGLAAALFQEYGVPDAPAFDPRQPLIFAIGPLTGCFPLMSKAVCAFKSPYHEQYTESHAGGRLPMAMRFAHIDALVFVGRAARPSCVIAGIRKLEMHDVHALWGQDVFSTGKQLRRMFRRGPGHRSTVRIGPAGENLVPYACLNVDTYRHFGRLGAGAVAGSKNLKAFIVNGESSFPAPATKTYAKLFQKVYQQVVDTDMMSKYHSLGTAGNVAVLNKIQALPVRNLRMTVHPKVDGITGETFAKELLLRKTACAGCPVGCIHVGLLREMFASDNEYLYRQVSYDHEPIFACGAMLGMSDASGVLAILDECERQGLDVMSAGVALAWATEAFERGVVKESETIVPLHFDEVKGYCQAVRHLGARSNEFYRLLGQGAAVAAKAYGGEDYACVLGQEMAGYATGEAFFVSQALGFRHSHLDTGGYTLDQKTDGKPKIDKALAFFLDDERKRVTLTSMVSCLFARNVYSDSVLQEALASMGLDDVAANLVASSEYVQRLRWQTRFATGFDPATVKIPKRFSEVKTWKGPIDGGHMEAMQAAYADEIRKLGAAA